MGSSPKRGAINRAALFRLIERHAEKILPDRKGILEKIVVRCSQIKAWVVTEDEKETKGLRMILNYGHTFAHAFERGEK